MPYQFINPCSILKPFIKHYWILEGDDLKGDVCTQRICPTGTVEMIFHYGDRYLYFFEKDKPENQPLSQIVGQSTGYYDVMPTGKIGLIAVTFKPDAARLFLNIPVNEIENISVGLENIFGKQIRMLEEKIIAATENTERIEYIENFLIKHIRQSFIYDYKRINYSVHKINEYRGMISVTQLADYACLSTKQFNRKFTQFVGSSPKQFNRVVRFQNAIFKKQTNSSSSLTDLALQCGYYDQAHFTNEFKSFTGYSPKDFFKICEPFSDYFS